jgi:hypothetical protein
MSERVTESDHDMHTTDDGRCEGRGLPRFSTALETVSNGEERISENGPTESQTTER